MSSNKRAIDTNIPIIFGVTLMAVLGVSSITPVFPQIMREMNLSETRVGLLITTFTLPGVFLTPFLGIIADRFGRKRILLPGLALFGVAGGMCAFAPDFNTLLALRTLQGIGAAPLGALNVTIIGDLYQGNQRARVMGLNASVLSIGTAFYPIIGGSLATLAWHYPFHLPWLAIPLCLGAMKYLKNPEPSSEQTLKQYLNGAWEGIKNKKVIGLFATGILVFIILFGSYLTYFSILMGEVFKASSFTIGVLMFSSSITTALVSSQLGRLSKKFKKQTLMMAGFVGYITAMCLIPLIPLKWFFLIPTLILGASQGLVIPSLQTLLSEQASLEYRGIIMSLNGGMLRIGQTLGPLVMGLVFTFTGYHGPFWTGATIAVICLAIAATLLTEPRRRAHQAE